MSNLLKVNDLDKIQANLEELGLTFDQPLKSSEGGSDCLQVHDSRGYNWEVVYYITETECNVIELNYDCECVEQSDETVASFEEALEAASTWC